MELNSIINALGWTILNSLWQGLFVLLILTIAMVIINPKYSKIRSMIAFACLLFIFTASIRTFSDLYTSKTSLEQNLIPTVNEFSDFALFNEISAENNIIANTSISTWDIIISYISSYGSKNINYIVTIWFFGMLFLTIRMLGGYFYMQRMKTQNLVQVKTKWQKMVVDISKKLDLSKHVKMFESTIIKFPTVIGYFKPVILMPLGSLAGMPADQIEMILAHELAHIKRTDYLLNLVQSFLEILYFFNPSVWIISKIVRNEREYACDDLALELNSNSTILANALLTLHQNKFNKPAVALSALGTQNSLLGRIKRMIHKNNVLPNYQKKIMYSAFLIIALFTLTIIACSSSLDNYNSQGSTNASAVNFSSNVSEPPFVTSTNKPEEITPVEEVERPAEIIVTENYKTNNSNKKFNFHKDDVHWKGEMKNGKLVTLYKDGERIPDDKLKDNKKFVIDTLEEINEALSDIEIDMDDLKNLSLIHI